MTPDDFRRLALDLPGAEAGAHMGAVDFRLDGRIFATLAHAHQGYANLMLSPDLQRDLIASAPDLFLPVPGGWGRMGATHIRLARATEAEAANALYTAWQLRSERNRKSTSRPAKKSAPANEAPAKTSQKKAIAKKSAPAKMRTRF